MPEHTPAPTPSRAVYGFVMFLCFRLFSIVYVVWAVVPEEYFFKVGIEFLPQRYWAVTVPIFILTVLWTFAFIIYPGLGMIMTPHIDDMRTITDKIGSKRKNNGRKLETSEKNLSCCCINQEQCWKSYYDLGRHISDMKKIPKLKDLDIWEVSERLYLRK